MAEYYLISQLPSLDSVSYNTPLSIDEERFFELCRQFLRKKAQNEIEKLTLLPPAEPEQNYSRLLSDWYEGERNLRFALAKVRAEKMNKSFELENEQLPEKLLKVANEAANAENPFEAEIILYDYRMSFLESLRPMDAFAEDYLFYYGLKLKLIMRMKRFNKELGEAAYKNIYSSILSGDRMEAL